MNDDTRLDCIDQNNAYDGLYQKIGSLRNQLEQKEKEIERMGEIVDKLPKYADTRETFVPKVDQAWIINYNRSQKGKNEKPEPIHNASKDRSYCEWGYAEENWYVYWSNTNGQIEVETEFYSTKEAAEQAKGGDDEGM